MRPAGLPFGALSISSFSERMMMCILLGKDVADKDVKDVADKGGRAGKDVAAPPAAGAKRTSKSVARQPVSIHGPLGSVACCLASFLASVPRWHPDVLGSTPVCAARVSGAAISRSRR